VFHPLQDLKTLPQNTVGPPAPYIRHEPYTAGIMLILHPVQTAGTHILGALVTSPLFFPHDGSLVQIWYKIKATPKPGFWRDKRCLPSFLRLTSPAHSKPGGFGNSPILSKIKEKVVFCNKTF
jgi:hypothetical protein